VLWATANVTDELPMRLLGYLLGAVVVVNGVGVGWTDSVAPSATVAAIVFAAAATQSTDHRWRGVGRVPTVATWGLLSLGGIYSCVPETDHIRWLAIAVGVLIVGAIVAGSPVDSGALAVMCGLLGWAVLYGGQYRDSAMIGGLGSFGLLLLEPLARLLPNRRSHWPTPAIAGVLTALQAIGCLVIGRKGGLRADAPGALVVVVPIMFAMAAICWVLGAPPRANGAR
jgi:hypothetical protein